jgi:hypothetical protein
MRSDSPALRLPCQRQSRTMSPRFSEVSGVANGRVVQHALPLSRPVAPQAASIRPRGLWRRRRTFMLMRCPRGPVHAWSASLEHIFLLLGLVGAVAGTLVAVLGGDDEPWQVVGAAMIGFASALVAVAAVTYLWNWLGGDPLKVAMDEVAGSTKSLDTSVDELAAGVAEAVDATGALRESVRIMDDTYRTGLRRFHPRASEFGLPSRWARLLESAEREIDLMGWTLAGWWATGQTGHTLRKALAKGVDVRVLVVDPENPFIDKPSGEDKPPDSTSSTTPARAQLSSSSEEMRGFSSNGSDEPSNM